MGEGNFGISAPKDDSILFYDDTFENRLFTPEQLNQYLTNVRNIFDYACDLMMDRPFSIVNYSILLCNGPLNLDNRIGRAPVLGGFDLAVPGSDFVLPEFRREYPTAIEQMLQEVSIPTKLNGQVYLEAFPYTEERGIIPGFVPDNI